MKSKKNADFVGRLKNSTLEVKQITGLEVCQRRQGRIQRNHIAGALLMWNDLKKRAALTVRTVYYI